MRKFFLGCVVGVLLVAAAGFLFVRLGLFNPGADIPVGSLESAVAMPSLDAAVDRHASSAVNPVPATDANLFAGAGIYQTNCASCHGDMNHPHGIFADAFYPRAPQFVEDAPDMADNQNFYIIQHGIRLSGMPAWKQALTTEQMWQVTTFLREMNKLPPQVSDAWRASAK
jgi:mono/diheme cytochrome c family protein